MSYNEGGYGENYENERPRHHHGGPQGGGYGGEEEGGYGRPPPPGDEFGGPPRPPPGEFEGRGGPGGYGGGEEFGRHARQENEPGYEDRREEMRQHGNSGYGYVSLSPSTILISSLTHLIALLKDLVVTAAVKANTAKVAKKSRTKAVKSKATETAPEPRTAAAPHTAEPNMTCRVLLSTLRSTTASPRTGDYFKMH